MLDNSVEPRTASFLKSRHANSYMIIQTNAGDAIILKPTSGGIRGDAAMAQEFSAAYDPLLENWLEKKDEEGITIKAEDPQAGDILDVGTTVLAYDVCETNLTENAEHMLQTEKRLSEMLAEELGKADLVQNTDEAEHAPTFKKQTKKTAPQKRHKP